MTDIHMMTVDELSEKYKDFSREALLLEIQKAYFNLDLEKRRVWSLKYDLMKNVHQMSTRIYGVEYQQPSNIRSCN